MAGPVLTFPEGEFAAGAAERIAAALRDVDSFMLTGGSTVRPVYEHLASVAGVEWPRMRVFFGDERAVPPSDADSNYRMADEALLSRVEAGAVHRMRGEWEDRDAAAREYASLLPERIDLLLLGVGADGHVASLFPGAPELEEEERRVVPSDGPTPPHRRLTVTPPVIRGAVETIVLVAGEGKAAAVRDALVGGPEEVDAAAVRDCPARMVRDALWILDEAAASLVTQS